MSDITSNESRLELKKSSRKTDVVSMENKAPIVPLDFIFFKTPKEDEELCKLKDFINFLRFTGKRLPIRFSYVEQEGQLLNNLTLRENIILESIPTTLSSKNNEIQLANHIKKTGNHYLMRLLNKLSLLDVFPNKIDNQSRKIAALIQGLLKDSEYLFFQSPEKHLKPEILELFIQALHFQRLASKQTVIIQSPNHDIWKSFINKTVEKEGYNFNITQPQKELTTPIVEVEDKIAA